MSDKTKLVTAKGVKDWYGNQALLRNRVKDILRETFERYGFMPLETPIIERSDVLSFKGGGEIQKEIFKLRDQGKRDLALRFDHTIPLARFYASHPELKSPFKCYSIGEVFRDGPTQPEQGRYRIFTQCDVDIVGVKGMSAEVELLALISDTFKALGLGSVSVKLNNRKVLNGIMDAAFIPDQIQTKVILILDKLDKIGLNAVKKELSQISPILLSRSAIDFLINNIVIKGTSLEKITFLDNILTSENGQQGLDEIKQIFDYCKEMKFDFIDFDPSLARGLDYYTSTTLEVFLKNKDIISSAIIAGGRYDNMIGDFKGSKEPVPAIGISFGLERVCISLELHKDSINQTPIQLYIIPLNTLKQSLNIVHIIRSQKINVDIDITGRSMKAAMRHANSQNIPFVGIIGEHEINKKVVSIKRLSDGLQNEVPFDDVKDYLIRDSKMEDIKIGVIVKKVYTNTDQSNFDLRSAPEHGKFVKNMLSSVNK